MSVAGLPDFNPDADERLTDANLVFRDGRALIAEHERKVGGGKVPDRGYFVAKVPEVPVYVLYGVDDASHTITVVSIRTWTGSPN